MDRDQQIMARFDAGEIMGKIARDFDITPERVRQIVSDAGRPARIMKARQRREERIAAIKEMNDPTSAEIAKLFQISKRAASDLKRDAGFTRKKTVSKAARLDAIKAGYDGALTPAQIAERIGSTADSVRVSAYQYGVNHDRSKAGMLRMARRVAQLKAYEELRSLPESSGLSPLAEQRGDTSSAPHSEPSPVEDFTETILADALADLPCVSAFSSHLSDQPSSLDLTDQASPERFPPPADFGLATYQKSVIWFPAFAKPYRMDVTLPWLSIQRREG